MKTFIIQPDPHPARDNCLAAVRAAPAGMVVTIREAKRSDDQNAKLHAAIGEIAKQKTWNNESLSIEEWKRLFSAAVFREKMLPGLNGGIVIIPKFTRRMSKAEVSELIEFVHCWGAENGVQFSQ